MEEFVGIVTIGAVGGAMGGLITQLVLQLTKKMKLL